MKMMLECAGVAEKADSAGTGCGAACGDGGAYLIGDYLMKRRLLITCITRITQYIGGISKETSILQLQGKPEKKIDN